MFKAIIILLIFLGVLFVAIDVVRIHAGLVEKKPEVIYKYIPRTFAEEQMDPVYASEVFETMFSQPSPWILSIREYDQKKQEKINQYFVSQL